MKKISDEVTKVNNKPWPEGTTPLQMKAHFVGKPPQAIQLQRYVQRTKKFVKFWLPVVGGRIVGTHKDFIQHRTKAGALKEAKDFVRGVENSLGG